MWSFSVFSLNQEYGIVLVRDPRVSEVDNDQFLDQMEKYYGQSDGVKDARPEVSGPSASLSCDHTSFDTRLFVGGMLCEGGCTLIKVKSGH